MKKSKNDDKKNIIIMVLTVLVLVLGIWCVNNIKTKKTEYFSLSYISIPDGDFTNTFTFKYDHDIIEVGMLTDENKLEIRPVKEGSTTLEVIYFTNSGEKKTITNEISVHSRLFPEIDNK